eukprot:scaffold1992_cov187-Amphora_coffeaeformis.AAC.28
MSSSSAQMADEMEKGYQVIVDNVPTPQFKVLLIGDGGVGKEAYLKRLHSCGRFLGTLHVAVCDVTVYKFCFFTNRGPIVFNVWLVWAGHAKFGGLRDHLYGQAQGAILMFDVTSRITYKNIPSHHRDVTRVCGGIPMVLCGNKVEIKDRKAVIRAGAGGSRNHAHLSAGSQDE